MPTKLTESEILRYRTTVYGMAATMGRVPRMSFGRDRYGMGAALSQVGHMMRVCWYRRDSALRLGQFC